MEETGVKRKLAVILAADFAGYSRLMGADEEATHKTLRAYREIIDGLIAGHDGRISATAGDSVVASASQAWFTGASRPSSIWPSRISARKVSRTSPSRCALGASCRVRRQVP